MEMLITLAIGFLVIGYFSERLNTLEGELSLLEDMARAIHRDTMHKEDTE